MDKWRISKGHRNLSSFHGDNMRRKSNSCCSCSQKHQLEIYNQHIYVCATVNSRTAAKNFNAKLSKWEGKQEKLKHSYSHKAQDLWYTESEPNFSPLSSQTKPMKYPCFGINDKLEKKFSIGHSEAHPKYQSHNGPYKRKYKATTTYFCQPISPTKES